MQLETIQEKYEEDMKKVEEEQEEEEVFMFSKGRFQVWSLKEKKACNLEELPSIDWDIIPSMANLSLSKMANSLKVRRCH